MSTLHDPLFSVALQHQSTNLADALERLNRSGYVYTTAKASSGKLRCYIYEESVFLEHVGNSNSTRHATHVFQVPNHTQSPVSQLRCLAYQYDEIVRFLQERSEFSTLIAPK